MYWGRLQIHREKHSCPLHYVFLCPLHPSVSSNGELDIANRLYLLRTFLDQYKHSWLRLCEYSERHCGRGGRFFVLDDLSLGEIQFHRGVFRDGSKSSWESHTSMSFSAALCWRHELFSCLIQIAVWTFHAMSFQHIPEVRCTNLSHICGKSLSFL